MVMPIAGNDGPMGPDPLGPWALAHWPMGPGPLGPWALAHFGLRGTKNIDFSKSLGMASPGVEMSGYLGGVFLSYLEPPNSHIVTNQKK